MTTENETHKLSYTALASFVLKACGAGLGFLIQLILARNLSAEDFGIFIVAFSISTSVMVVASFGMPFSAIKYIPDYIIKKKWNKAKGFFTVGFICTLMGSFVFCTLSLIVLHFQINNTNNSLYTAILYSIALIPFLAISQTLVAYLQSMQKIIDAELIANIIRPIVTIIGVLTLLYISADRPTAIDVLQLTLLGVVVSVLVGAWRFKALIPQKITLSVSEYAVQDWFKAGLAVMVIMGGAVLNERIDVMLVGALQDVESAGIYGVCARIAFIVGFALAAVNSILGPMLSKIYATRDSNKLKKMATIGAWLAFSAASFMSIFVAVFADFILGIFGQSFVMGNETLKILLIGHILVAAFGATGTLVILLGGYKITLISVSIGLIMNVFLNLLLIPIYGIKGAAIATVIGLFISYLIITIWCLGKSGINSTILGIISVPHSRYTWK